MRRRNRRRPINRVAQFLAWLRDFAHRNRERERERDFSFIFFVAKAKTKGALKERCGGTEKENVRVYWRFRVVLVYDMLTVEREIFGFFCFLRDLNR